MTRPLTATPNPITALVARVPEAEPWVGTLRERFDPSTRMGVPAHITVLAPFMPPDRVTAVRAAQGRAFRGHGLPGARAGHAFRLAHARHRGGVSRVPVVRWCA